jgi:hypothetical protein
MIPFLTYPLALIALSALPALAAIYLLRNRFRRRQVSSLVLWRFHLQSKSGGAKVQRLHLPLLFFLELLTLALLGTAAAGPQWKLPQASRPLIVVLDDSFSLRAVNGATSAQARATRFLENLFRQQPPPNTRIILAGTEPRSLGTAVKTWREVNELLPQWTCRSPQSALASALTLAAGLGKQQANILVLTDHKPADETVSNPRLKWRSFGSPVDNLAIVNASRTVFGDQDRCLVEIANYSGNALTTQLLVQAGSNAPQCSALLIGAHETQRMVFNLPSSTPGLRAWLDADALAEDNEIELLPPVRQKVRVRVLLTNSLLSTLANRTLDATGLRAALSDPPQLIIQDTASSNSNAWSLRWIGSGGTNAFTGPFFVDHAQRLADGIALSGVVWAGDAVTNSPGDVPVILAGNTPLLSTHVDVLGRHLLTLNCNPEPSTLQNTPDWPILFWNMMQWRIAEMPGLKENNVRLGAEVLLKTGGEAVIVTQPDGVHRSYPKSGNELTIETPMPGVYSVVMGASTNWFSVNALAADESDLSMCATGQWGEWSETTERRLEEASTVWILGLLALGLLVTHLFLLASGKGGSR